MKGVIASLCPRAAIHDLTHDTPPGDVRAGAFALATAVSLFPHGSIHIAVVDPGVGGVRKNLLVEEAGRFYIGPDNGLLSLAAPPPRLSYWLNRDEYFRPRVSPTFHGRDVFASVAGHLASGVRPTSLGTPIPDIQEIRMPAVNHGNDGVAGEVVHVDRFGNLITNLRAEHLPSAEAAVTVEIGRHSISSLATSYEDASPGGFAAMIGGSGYLEVAVRDGSAADRLGAGALGTVVRLKFGAT